MQSPSLPTYRFQEIWVPKHPDSLLPPHPERPMLFPKHTPTPNDIAWFRTKDICPPASHQGYDHGQGLPLQGCDPAVVPTPSTFGLALGGLLIAAWLRRRR